MEVLFPTSVNEMFSREFAFDRFVNCAYMCTWMHVYWTKFERKVLCGTITWSEMVKQTETYKLKRSISIFWFKPLVSDCLTHGVRRMNYATQQTQTMPRTFRESLHVHDNTYHNLKNAFSFPKK